MFILSEAKDLLGERQHLSAHAAHALGRSFAVFAAQDELNMKRGRIRGRRG